MMYKSEMFGEEYDIDEVRFIPNMLQNARYMSSPLAKGELVDIILGKDDKIVFVWRKSENTKKLYDLWCKHEL